MVRAVQDGGTGTGWLVRGIRRKGGGGQAGCGYGTGDCREIRGDEYSDFDFV